MSDLHNDINLRMLFIELFIEFIIVLNNLNVERINKGSGNGSI